MYVMTGGSAKNLVEYAFVGEIQWVKLYLLSGNVAIGLRKHWHYSYNVKLSSSAKQKQCSGCALMEEMVHANCYRCMAFSALIGP